MGKQSYEIVSNEYYSNCMMEALKAKIHNPKVKLYFCKPRITENGQFQMFHFMWSDGTADYDFSDLEEPGLPPYRNLLFKGVIRKFDLGFAQRYCKYRNGGNQHERSRTTTYHNPKRGWIFRKEIK